VRAAWPLCRATWVVVRPRRARDGAVYARSRPVPPRADGTPPGTRYKVYTTYTSLTYLTTHVRRLYSILRVAASEQTERRAHRSPYPRTEERSRPREPGAGRDGLAPGTGGLSGLSDRALGSRSRSRTRWRGSSTVVDVSCRYGYILRTRYACVYVQSTCYVCVVNTPSLY
jgi:hypothetical protein